MLANLAHVHAQLLEAIAKLAVLTEQTTPDAQALAVIRWRLSRTSGQRQRIVAQACESLEQGASAEQAQSIQTLIANSGDMRLASSQHIRTWTIEQITADWPGYCAASAEMRKSMRARIEFEKSVLYPLLAAAP